MSPGDLVRYLDFVATIDSQFGNTDLALSNIQTLKQNSAISSGEEQETLAELLNYIKWSISSKRIYLKNPLQDYDKTKSTYIKRDQFIRVLDNLGLVRNGQLADLLCRKYSRSSNPKEICYVDFIKDVENINEV